MISNEAEAMLEPAFQCVHHACKLCAYRALSSAARTVAQTLKIPHAQQGFIAAGTPIGPPAYVTQHVSAKVDDVIATVNFAWEPQAPTQASRPRLVTVVSTCKAATLIMP